MDLNMLQYKKDLRLQEGDALIVVDTQNDFMTWGALPAKNGESIIEGMNETIEKFQKAGLPIVLTQDWHPGGHHSFASVHKGKKPFDLYEAYGLGPVLWPDHCVQNSEGAEFHKDLNTKPAHAIIRKGYCKEIDSYSGFLENDHKTETGLDGYLKGRGVKRIFAGGLALDYCLFFTCAVGADKGFQVSCVTDLSSEVGAPENSVTNALETMTNKGVKFTKKDELHV